MASKHPWDASESVEREHTNTEFELAGAIAEVLAAEEAMLGQQLGRYELVRRLGAGGMGEVFEARHLDSGERVALKILSHTHLSLRHRFKREFRALADLAHPNLISLGELVVLEHGAAFFTMELIVGRQLVRWVRDATPSGIAPPLDRLEHAIRQLARGLMHLHARRRVHRDLKPSNVLVDERGRVVILDFGLVLDLDSDVALTRDSQRLGTLSYMAPEQTQTARVGPPADVYAVGVMLWECLTGRTPWSGSMAQIMLAKHTAAAPDIAALPADVPLRLRELCIHMLASDPNLRPSARELLGELGDHPTSDDDSETEAPLVGRDHELGQLHAALEHVSREQAPVVVHIRGEAGVGKSTLLRAFAGDAQQRGSTLVLRARCRERETLSYQAFDDALDGLALYLGALTPERRDELRPTLLAALVSEFPAFEHVWATTPKQTDSDDRSREFAWAGLRELIAALAQLDPPVLLILLIDDFQADAESAALLEALTHGPRAPAVLFVITTRSDAAGFPLPGCELRTLELRAPLPCIGRERELRMLTRLFDECVDAPGGAQVVVLSGAPGIGKSRLAREFIRVLSNHPSAPTFLTARADPRVGVVHALLANLVAPTPPSSSTIVEDFVGTLTAACERAPVVLVLEDFHDADPASVAAINQALTQLEHCRLFVLTLARPDLRARFQAIGTAHSSREIRLGALARKAAERLARIVLGEAADTAVVGRIVELSEGNPASLLAHSRSR